MDKRCADVVLMRGLIYQNNAVNDWWDVHTFCKETNTSDYLREIEKFAQFNSI